MKRVTKSARGVAVDFDLLKIKQQMATAPKTTDVKARESFIDQKFKRRLKKLTQEVAPAAVRTEPVAVPVLDPLDADPADTDEVEQ
jgi:hypothetical protein